MEEPDPESQILVPATRGTFRASSRSLLASTAANYRTRIRSEDSTIPDLRICSSTNRSLPSFCDSATPPEVPQLTEKTPDKAQRMIHDLLLVGISGEKIAKGTKISSMTISAIKNGKNKRISEKVFDAIWNFYDEKAPPREEMERLRAERASEVPASPVTMVKQTPKAASKLKPKVNAENPKAHKPSGTSVTIDLTGFISRDYLPVNVPLLTQQIDGLIARFRQAVIELEQIKSQIR